MNPHRQALKDQARAIRLAAQTLERLSKDTTDEKLDDPLSNTRIVLARQLGTIRINLDALYARFGKATR